VKELRRKSFDDLHRLWFVLYRERNMLLTEAHISRVNSQYMTQTDRAGKVKKSMGAIKHVLGEREREQNARDSALQATMDQAEFDAATLDGPLEEKRDSKM